MTKRPSCILTLAAAFGLFAGAAALRGQDIEPVVTTLPNGVRVAIVENHQAPVVSCRLYVRAGSLYEGQYLGAGVSHFLEHLLSSGATGKRTEAESRKILDAIGAQTNAYTTRDHTCYYITTASRFFDSALDLLSDWAMNCALTPEEFQREYEVVQREMESRDSDPNTILHELSDQTVFSVYPARHPVIGYRDAFRGLTRDDVWSYYRRMYVPDNVLFVAAGDLDPQKAMEQIRTAFAKFERRPVPAIALPQEPPQVSRRTAVKEMPATQAYLMMSCRTIPLSHPDLYALDLLSFILSNGDSSRLVRKVREEKRLVSSIDTSSYTPSYDGGEFVFYARLDPDKLAAAQDAILEEIRRVRDELVSEEELKRAKRQKVSEYVFGLQTVEAQASNVAMDILAADDPQFSRSYVKRIQQTAAEEIRAVARKYLSDDKLCVAVVRPPEAAATKPPAEAAPATPAVEHIVLGNGLRLLVKRNPAQPLVAVQAYWLGGLRAEPPGKNGLSMFAARMLPRGTERRSAEEIARLFDDMGGSLEGTSGNNSAYLSAACLAADCPATLEVFADALRNPAFTPQEIERLRPLLIARAERQKDDWREELAGCFRRDFFKSHPYRNLPIGAPDDLKAITHEDLVEFHRRWCVPNNVVLAVFGDVDPARVKELVEKHLGDWPSSGRFEPPAPAAEAPPAEDRSLEAQTRHRIAGVFIGYPGLTVRDEKDRYALDVLDALTSGIQLPRGWLHETLRGKGLVYEVHAYVFPGIEPGYFGIYAGCEPARAQEVKEIILQQIARLFNERISEDELESARRICITANVLDRQTDAEQASEAAINELYGLGYDFGSRYEPGVLAVTESEVKRVAQKYFTHYVCVMMLPPKAEPKAGAP